MEAKKLLIPILSISLLLGGCSIMNDIHQSNTSTKAGNSKQNSNAFMSVQKYTGKGYFLNGGEENGKIANAHKSEVAQAVQKFFLEKYKTKVKVHNLVGNQDGVTAFVESIGDPHFHTFAVVPIDKTDQKIRWNEVFSQEGQVEDAIRSGIYAMMYSKEIQVLDNYLKGFTSKYPVVGTRIEAVDNVGSGDYSTPYYYISVTDEAFNVDVERMYLKNPNMTKEEWKKVLLRAKINPKFILVTLQLFMKEPNKKPDKAIFNQMVSDIVKMKGLPPGAYSILLHDNRIDKGSATGQKENSLERGDPNEIIKY